MMGVVDIVAVYLVPRQRGKAQKVKEEKEGRPG